MMTLFQKGGLVMWPLLVLSFASLTIIFERGIFYLRQMRLRRPRYVTAVLGNVEKGKYERARMLAAKIPGDFILRTLAHGLSNRKSSLTQALEAQALRELHQMKKNLSILDTIITAAPLLGILGTVLGIISSFHILGSEGIGDPLGVTKGISEALITTAYGLIIALVTLIPFNYYQAMGSRNAEELESVCTTLEIINQRKAESSPRESLKV